MAERAGFEPAVLLPVHSISNTAQSATLPPLQRYKGKKIKNRVNIKKEGAEIAREGKEQCIFGLNFSNGEDRFLGL